MHLHTYAITYLYTYLLKFQISNNQVTSDSSLGYQAPVETPPRKNLGPEMFANMVQVQPNSKKVSYSASRYNILFYLELS